MNELQISELLDGAIFLFLGGIISVFFGMLLNYLIDKKSRNDAETLFKPINKIRANGLIILGVLLLIGSVIYFILYLGKL